MERMVSKMMAPLGRALNGMIARGSVALVNAGAKLQTLQVKLLADEVKSDMEHFEAYGFTSHPKAGAEAITAFVGGDRSHGVVLVVADRRYRLTGLVEGEVAMYSDEGDSIVFRRGRTIEVNTLNYVVNASGGGTFNGDLNINGSVHASGDVTAGSVSLQHHTHGGVQTGGGSTSQPN